MRNRDDIFTLIKENEIEKIKLLFKDKTNNEILALLKKTGNEKYDAYVLSSFEWTLFQDNLSVFKELFSYFDFKQEEYRLISGRALLLVATARKWQLFEMILNKFTEKISLCARWSKNKNTLAHVLVESNNLEMLRLLLPKYKLDFVTRKNEQDQSPIMLAASLGHFALVQALLDYFLKNSKANQKMRIDYDLLGDEDSLTILQLAYAAKTNEREIIKAIFTYHQFKRDVASLPWLMFLSRAIENERLGQVQGIINAVVEKDLKIDLLASQDGKTILDLACEKKQWKIAELLLKSIKFLTGIDNAKRNHDVALQYAIRHGQYIMAELLLKDGHVKINQVDVEHGNVFLHDAILNNRSDLVELLLKYKADLNQKNSQGQTILEFARSLGHSDCVNVLEKAQAKQQMGILSTVSSLFKTITQSKQPENIAALTDTQKIQVETITQSDISGIKLEPVYERKQTENNEESFEKIVSDFRAGISGYY